MSRQILITLSTSLSLILAVSTRAASSQASVTPPVGTEDFKRYVEAGKESPFGLDYVFVLDNQFRKPELVRQLAGFMGVRWVNFARVNWGELEPNAPKNGQHLYKWDPLDEAVRQWQQFGVHIMMSLRFVNRWANGKPTGEQFTYLSGPFAFVPKGIGDYLPTPDHQQNLRDYIHALVERYDGDGINDMPGLLFPVLHYQVCNEAYNELFWAGTVEEYGLHLKEVAHAARRANPNVKIILSGVCFNRLDGFYTREMDQRTNDYVQSQLPKCPPKMLPFLERMDDFSRRSLKFPDYDIVDARWSYFGVISRCREELRLAGRPNLEIWSAEIYTAHPLLDAMVLPMTTLHPYPTPSRSLDYIRILRTPRDMQFAAVNRWYRGMQASMVVKCCMIGLSAGSKKLMNGWALDSQGPLSVYPLSVGGYKSTTFDKLWPAAYTYKLLIHKLDGITSCRRVPNAQYVFLYECTVRDNKRVFVAFCDDHVARNHDEPPAVATAEVALGAEHARVTYSVTDLDQTEPKVEILPSPKGRLSLRVTEYPVFIEPLASP